MFRSILVALDGSVHDDGTPAVEAFTSGADAA